MASAAAGAGLLVAGVVIETSPGAAARVAARLAREPALEMQGGDGDRRIAAVLTAPDGDALAAFAEGVLARDDEVLGVYPTYVAREEPGGEG